MNLEKIIKLAVEEAEKSKFYSYRVGCIIFERNTIISKGHNYQQRGVKSFTRKFMNYPFSIHAELCAILNAKTDLKRKSLLVVRLNNTGKLKLARPCNYCYGYIKYVGIKDIYYSTNDGVVLREKV